MSKLPIGGLEAFLAVVEHGSLRAAAAALGVQPPAVSYQLKALEDQVGVPVFTRTTRSIQLTDAGRALLKRTQPAVLELNRALEEARGIGKARRGTIRVTLPYIAYELAIAPRLVAFHKKYPDVEIELSLNEAFVDLAAQRFHAGIRMGDHIQEDMVAVRLTPPLKEVYFGAPSYFAAHGRPQRPEDLLRHDCIRYRYIGSKRIAEWQFRGPEGVFTVDVKGCLIVDSTAAVVRAVRDGLGISWLFRANIHDDLKSGALETILDRHTVERPGFYLYYPRENARLEILRLFVEFMRAKRI